MGVQKLSMSSGSPGGSLRAMTTGEKLRMLREQRGWSREFLAEVSRTPLRWIEEVEEGRRKPQQTGMPLFIIAVKLDIEVHELWADT